MIIDNEAYDESNFTLMTKEEYLHFGEDAIINEVLEKHQILHKKDYLSHSMETNYLLLVQYLEDCFYFNKPIPEDILKIIQENITFNNYIIKNNKKRLDNLFSNGGAIFFKEIITIVKFLSNGQNYDIFKTYNDYDYELMGQLFRDYEFRLSQLNGKEPELFETVLKAYCQLIEAYTNLCVINATDLKRKQSISNIVNLITETINMLKFSVRLEEKHMDMINNYLGKVLYYFSHLSYIDAKDKEVSYFLDEFALTQQRQYDGFNVSKDTDFGGNPSAFEDEYISYKDNCSYLLLLLLEKLKYNYKPEEYQDANGLKGCIALFNKSFPFLPQGDSSDLKAFKNILLNALTQNYKYLPENRVKNYNYKEAINDFILSADQYQMTNIRLVHHALMFADDIEDYKYLHIGETLVESPLIPNDYYEFYKLKTLDIIINYFVKNETKEDLKPFISKVNKYIEKNKKASHLLSIFSKIYLSIAHYYASCDDESSVLKAKVVYNNFININGYEILEKEYKWINLQILTTFGRYYVKDLELDAKEFAQREFVNLGKKLATNYIELHELELKFNITKELTQLSNKILYENFIDYDAINETISELISDQIFYGLSAVYVEGLSQRGSNIIDHGYKHYAMKITEQFTLQFIFPAVYEKGFSNILNNNKDFIQSNISSLLASLSKSSEVHLHSVTNLENKEKLKYDLNNFNYENVTFVEILIGALPSMNLKFGFTVGDKFLSTITQKIKSIVQPDDRMYYIGSGRIGILLADANSFRGLTDKVLNFKIKKAGSQIDPNFTITVTSAHKQSVIEESEQTLNKAMLKNKKLLFNQ